MLACPDPIAEPQSLAVPLHLSCKLPTQSRPPASPRDQAVPCVPDQSRSLLSKFLVCQSLISTSGSHADRECSGTRSLNTDQRGRISSETLKLPGSLNNCTYYKIVSRCHRYENDVYCIGKDKTRSPSAWSRSHAACRLPPTNEKTTI